MIFRRLFIAFILIFSAQPAWAAVIDKAGADHLGRIFEKFMSDRKALIEADGFTKIDYEGVAVVEPAKDYYAVTLPVTTITYKDGTHFELGMISINATPHDKPGQWQMSIAMPTPINMSNVNGSIETKINLGEQRAVGIWDEALEGFSKLDAVYKNVVIENYKFPYTATIPNAQVVYEYAKDEKGLWSGPGHITADHIGVVSPLYKAHGTINSVRADFALDQYNAAALKTYKQKLSELTQNLADKKTPEAGAPPAQIKDLYGPLLDLLTAAGNGFKIETALSGVDFTWQGKDGTAPGLFKLPQANASIHVNGFNSNISAAEISFGYDGLEIQSAQSSAYKDMTPTKAHLAIAAQNIPFKQIADLGKNTMAVMGHDTNSPLAGLTFMVKMPALLSQSGATVTVKNNYISNENYSAAVNGIAKANIAAVNSATIHMIGIFQGLDKTIVLAQAQADNPQNKDAENFRTLAENLKMLKNYAKTEVGTDKASRDVIDFVMNEKGQLLVNGRDLQSVIMNPTPTEVARVPAVKAKPVKHKKK